MVALASTRGYPEGSTPQSPTFPFWTFRLISSIEIASQNGGTDWATSRVTISSYGEDTSSKTAEYAATELGDTIHDSLIAFSGTLGTGANTVIVQHVQADIMSDRPVDPVKGSETKRHCVDEDFLITHATS